MKRIIVLYLAVAPVGAFAAEPSTSCPSGYVAVVEEHMDIANTSCPSGYTSAGTATSCIAPPAQQPVVSHPTPAAHVSCMRRLGCPIQTPPAHMNLNGRVQWNKPPRHNHPRKLHFRGARYRATPPQRGTLARDGNKNPAHMRGQHLYSKLCYFANE